MKLSDISTASNLNMRRLSLLDDIAQARGKGLGVTLQGRYQDDEVVNAARGAVIDELQRRVREIDAELAGLGVDLGTGAP